MKRIIALGIAVLVVVLAWTGAWFYAASEIKKSVAMMAEGDGVTNPKITCASLGVGGFPFRFDVACTEAVMVSGDLRAELAELRGSMLVYQPTLLRFWAKSPLGLRDDFTGSRSTLSFDALEMSARFKDWRIDRVSLVGEALRWADALFVEAVIAEAGHLEAHLLDMPEQHQDEAGLAALASFVTAQDVFVPGIAVNAGTVSLEAEMTGLPDDVRAFAEPGMIERFRDTRGQLRIVSLKAEDGANFIDATGNAGLDDQARVDGQVTLKSRGLMERLEGLFDPAMKPLIAGSPAADGSYANTLFIRAGVFVSGVVPLFVIPPLL